MTENEIPNWILQSLAFLFTIFGFGKAWGVLAQKDLEQEKRINKLEKDLVSAILSRDKDVAKIHDLFVNDNNEPRFVTYSAHDKMQSSCQALIRSELTHIKETCDEIKMAMGKRVSDN